MPQGKLSEEQIIGLLKQVEGGRSVAEVCCEHGIAESTFSKWKSNYGGLEVNEARRLQQLEEPALVEIIKTNLKLNAMQNVRIKVVPVGQRHGQVFLHRCTGTDQSNEGLKFVSQVARMSSMSKRKWFR